MRRVFASLGQLISIIYCRLARGEHMRRFYRSANLAALVATMIAAAPAANRLAAQELQPMGTDSGTPAVVRDSAAAPAPTAAPASTVDFRTLHTEAAGSVATASARVALSASVNGLRSAAHTRENNGPLVVTAAASRANLGQAQALMIVGAAALITGAIIGDDPGTIIMVGGAVVGLYGLYQYLQ
jgi:hypothetical protein